MVQICMIYAVEHVLVCLTGLSIARLIDNITNLIIMRKCYSDIWKKYVSLRKNNNDLEIYQINGTYVYYLIFDSNVRTICLIVLELKTIKKFDWC